MLVSLLFFSFSAQALNFDADVELYAGYDDNINRKEEKRRVASGFLSISPGFSSYGSGPGEFSAGAGYRPVFTRYLAGDEKNQMFHSGWGEITKRLRPRLFATLLGRMDILKNDESPEDDGWGFIVSPGLAYHVSERLDAKLSGIYTRWKYDNLDFDTGRAVIRLDEPQVDNRYEIEMGLSYFLFVDSQLDVSYRYASNASNNDIDEYKNHHAFISLQTAFRDDFRVTVGYHFSTWDYSHWRAGKMLRGKLRDDARHLFWAGMEYSVTPLFTLFMNLERTVNQSNLKYESFDRNLVYGGIRLTWIQWDR